MFHKLSSFHETQIYNWKLHENCVLLTSNPFGKINFTSQFVANIDLLTHTVSPSNIYWSNDA